VTSGTTWLDYTVSPRRAWYYISPHGTQFLINKDKNRGKFLFTFLPMGAMRGSILSGPFIEMKFTSHNLRQGESAGTLVLTVTSLVSPSHLALYLNVFEYIYNMLCCTFNVFKCIQMYSNIFECIHIIS
jgi:hypothetical protein